MFLENNENGLVYMTSDRLPFRHMFTTRHGGVSTGHLATLNLIGGHGDRPENIRENFTRVTALLGVGPDDCCVTKQVHGNVVRTVRKADRHVCLSEIPYEADGIVTAEPGLPLFCFTADCVPVLLCDPVHRVVGAIHCGWRSSTTDILGNAVAAMCALGSEPQDIRAAIGPAIGACCFETHRDVPDAIEAWLGKEAAAPYFRPKPDPDSNLPFNISNLTLAERKFLVDLRGANACRLRQLGLRPESIDISEECTFCSHDKYWSHRYTKGMRGGQAACIVIPERGTEA